MPTVETRPSSPSPIDALVEYHTPTMERLLERADGRPLLYIDPIPSEKRPVVRVQAFGKSWVTVEPSVAGYGIFAIPFNVDWDPTKKGRKLVQLEVIHPATVYLGKRDENGKPVRRTLEPRHHTNSRITAFENNFKIWKKRTLPPQRHR